MPRERRAWPRVLAGAIIGFLVANAAVGPLQQATAAQVATTSATSATSPTTAAATGPAGTFKALTPARILDTRTGNGAPKVALAAHHALTLQVTGRGGIPNTAASATLTLTATSPTAAGSLTVHPAGTPTPNASNLNFTRGATVANLVIAALPATGKITIDNNSTGTINLIADTAGYTLVPHWGTPSLVHPPTGSVGALDCVSDTSCVAIDSLGKTWVLAGSTWSLSPPFPAPSVVSVSCVGNLHCVAVSSDLRSAIFDGGRWGATVDIGAPGTYGPTSISCPTSAFCAVSSNNGVVYTLASGTWTATTVDVDGTSIRNVSCPTATMCLAVADRGNTYEWNGTQWSAVGQVGLGQDVYLDCPSTTVCVAADNGHGATWSGAWGGIQAVTLDNGPWSVSCASTTYCRVGGASGQHVDWNGASFSDPVRDSATATRLTCTATNVCWGGLYALSGDEGVVRFAPSAVVTTFAIVQATPLDISCPTRAFCALIDIAASAQFDVNGSWQPTMRTQAEGGNPTPVSGIDCASSSFCAESTYNSIGGGALIAWNGSVWQTLARNYAQVDVDCPTSAFCMSPGSFNSVFTWDGTQQTPANVTAGGTLSAVSCPSVTYCRIVAAYGQVTTWNGTTWSTAVQVAPQVYNTKYISCSSPKRCAVVDTAGNAETWNGTAWTAPTLLAPAGDGFTGVNCPPTTSVWRPRPTATPSPSTATHGPRRCEWTRVVGCAEWTAPSRPTAWRSPLAATPRPSASRLSRPGPAPCASRRLGCWR